jgi:hypothetical protein
LVSQFGLCLTTLNPVVEGNTALEHLLEYY